MAHYAVLNLSNTVTQVFVGRDEDDLAPGVTDWEIYYAPAGHTVKRTSYNTRAGEHILGGEPFRKNYAGKGYTYDEDRDAFIPPKPFESWVLDETTCLWQAPVDMPVETDENGDPVPYVWDESVGEWVVSE